MSDTVTALLEVAAERMRQDELFPGQWPVISNGERLAILAEEFGEVARELCEAFLGSYVCGPNLRTELIQVAAVTVAWAEQLDG